jgi:hypothetical protein
MQRVVEFRSYRLRPDSGSEYARLFREHAVPMLEHWRIDVVRHGPSAHDPDAYILIRAYDDLDARERSQDAFYGSDEWRLGPREAILALLDTYIDVVLELDDHVIDQMRR